MSFGVARVFVPVLDSVDPAILVLTTAALIAILRFRAGMIATLAASGALGIAYFYAVK